MVTYTDADKVKDEIQNYDTSITDSIINVYIGNAEGLMNCTMGEDFTDIYDSTKPSHLILRLCATKLALMDLIKYDLQDKFGSSIGSLQYDMAKRISDRCLALLANDQKVKFLKGEAH